MKLSFKNKCLVFVGCVLSAGSLWIPFYACRNYLLCGDSMNIAFVPLIISVLVLGIGVFLLSTALLEAKPA